MNATEKKFIKSIEDKISYYKIGTILDDALDQSMDKFTETIYNNGEAELVDIGIERFLCKKSPYYFIANYAWVKLPNVGMIPFNPYYFQKNILLDLQKFQKVVCEKVRQCGLSTLFALYCLWRLNFRDAEDIDIVSLKQLKAQEFVAKMDTTLKYMPEFLKTPKIKDNEQVLEFANGSKVVSESQSENAGRSDTLSLLVLDEAAHYKSEKMVRGIVAAAQPTLSRTNGQFVVLSTPNRTSGPGAYYYEQVNQARLGGEVNTILVSVDWWEVPDTKDVEGPKKGYNQILKTYIDKDYYRHQEIKSEAQKFFMPIALDNWRDNPWLKKQHDDLQDILYKQEVLHSFIVGGNAVFPEDILRRTELRIIEPIETGKLGAIRADNIWTWKKPEPGHRYIIGVDVSTSTGDEFSSFQIIDVVTYEQVCEYKGMMATKNFGRLVKNAASYYNQAYVVIECNGIGEAVFNEVYYDELEPYQNVFKTKRTKNEITRMTGWVTDTRTRKVVTNEFMDWFFVDSLFEELKVHSKRLYLEMTTWIWDNGKPVHDSGATDDAIIAFSLALYLRNKAITSGESFLINEKGEFVEYDEKKDGAGREESKDKFEFTSTEEKESIDSEKDAIIKSRYGISFEDYAWLVGNRK
jgi:hypothetical protein